jgi:hypothetical protein
VEFAKGLGKPRDLGCSNEEMSKLANEPIAIDLGSGAGFPGLPLKIYAPHLSVTLIESNQKKATFLREVIRAIALTGVTVFPHRAEEYLKAVKTLEKTPSSNQQVSPGLPARAGVARGGVEISKSANERVVVSLRAVEHFDRVLPLAAQILGDHRHLNEPMSPGPPTRAAFARGGVEMSKSANEQMEPRLLALLIGSAQLPTVRRLLPRFSWSEPIPIPLSRSRILLFGRPSEEPGTRD